jgi:ribosomal protein S1
MVLMLYYTFLILSHGRVKKPADLVTIGQKLKVKITKIDKKLIEFQLLLKL